MKGLQLEGTNTQWKKYIGKFNLGNFKFNQRMKTFPFLVDYSTYYDARDTKQTHSVFFSMVFENLQRSNK